MSEDSTNPKVSSSKPEALSATPGMSKERGTGSRDSLTAARQMTTVTTPIGTLTQKIDDQGNTLSSKPPSTLPPATARPLIAAHSPIGPVLASGVSLGDQRQGQRRHHGAADSLDHPEADQHGARNRQCATD